MLKSDFDFDSNVVFKCTSVMFIAIMNINNFTKRSEKEMNNASNASLSYSIQYG